MEDNGIPINLSQVITDNEMGGDLYKIMAFQEDRCDMKLLLAPPDLSCGIISDSVNISDLFC